MVPSAEMAILPKLANLVPVEVGTTASPAASVTVWEAMVLWLWPSMKASRPVTSAIMSVER